MDFGTRDFETSGLPIRRFVSLRGMKQSRNQNFCFGKNDFCEFYALESIKFLIFMLLKVKKLYFCAVKMYKNGISGYFTSCKSV